MTKALLIADHLDGELNSSTARMVACAAELQVDALDLLVLTHERGGLGEAAAGIEGVSRVLVAENGANREPLAAILAPQIVAAVQGGDYSHLLCPNTTFGKDLLPRAAALLGVGQVTDIMAVHGPYRFDRPIYAGNAVTTVEAPSDQLLVGTVRCASYPEAGERAEPAPVENITLDAELPTHTRFISRDSGDDDDRPDLQTAARVVSGGRGVGSGDNFKIIYSLADKLGAAAGASRAAVDAGFVPNDMQVGQTGKIIAPELYVAVGISGAIQHLAGIKDAGTIVAINSDAEAPIFEIADIGLVGDLFEILPALEAQL